VHYRQYRQPLTTHDLQSLQSLLLNLTGEAEFHDWFRSELEVLELPDQALKGEAMKEEIYRKACMRDGAAWLYERMMQLSEAELKPDEGLADE
jgi:hypothetical protein